MQEPQNTKEHEVSEPNSVGKQANPRGRLGACDILANFAFWASLVASGFICGALALGLFPVLFLVDRKRVAAKSLACAWSWCCIAPLRALGLWTVELRGQEHVPAGFKGVIAPNHLSQFDILVLHSVLGPATWVSKSSVFMIPIIGWSMWTAGYVSLKRSEQKSIRDMTRKCARALAGGLPLVMFPEGTRSRDGTLQRFKHGAFLVAKKAGVPVMPVAISGTREALPPGRILIRSGVRVTVTFLPPIQAADVEQSSPAESAGRCHAAVARALAAQSTG